MQKFTEEEQDDKTVYKFFLHPGEKFAMLYIITNYEEEKAV